MHKETCLRCKGDLITTEKHKEITFYECQNCKRTYAKSIGKSLTDRWSNPISIALYGIIFEKEIVSDEFIIHAVGSLSHLDEKQKNILIEEIEEELNHPKQQLIHMLNLKGTEEIARDYLSRLVEELKNK